MYQQLLEDPTSGLLTEEPTGEGASSKVHKLLEEIKQLRRQLEQSIRNNVTLSDHLTHKLVSAILYIYMIIYDNYMSTIHLHAMCACNFYSLIFVTICTCTVCCAYFTPRKPIFILNILLFLFTYIHI